MDAKHWTGDDDRPWPSVDDDEDRPHRARAVIRNRYHGERAVMLRRTWRLIVLLRRGAWSLTALARELDCCARTIRRDLAVLEDAGLPVQRIGEGGLTRWSLLLTAEWPRDAVAPTEDLRHV